MIYNSIYSSLLFPLAEGFNRTSIQSKLRFLRKSQNWSREQLEKYQSEQLQKLIKHCYENVPYYRRLLDEHNIKPEEIKTPQDLKRIPVLTKEIVNTNFEELKAKGYRGKTFIKFTSGSTGLPTNFLRSAEDYSWEWAAHYRAWEWAGYKLGDKFVKISLNDDRYLFKKRMQDLVMRCLYLYVYKVGEENLDDYLEKIYKFQPKIIYGYTSSIKVLAEHMRDKGMSYKATAVITMGSKLTKAFRAMIEERFGCKVYDGYGCGGEGLNMAAQCENGSYHINEELVVLEADEGDVVVTNLHNYAMPLIRYKPMDNVKLGGECSCHKGLQILTSISGRTQEVVKTRSGKTLVVEFVISAFEFIDGINQYRVIQEDLDGVRVQLVVNEKYSKERDEQKIKDFFENAAKDLQITFEYPGKILTEKNGKIKIIESKLR